MCFNDKSLVAKSKIPFISPIMDRNTLPSLRPEQNARCDRADPCIRHPTPPTLSLEPTSSDSSGSFKVSYAFRMKEFHELQQIRQACEAIPQVLKETRQACEVLRETCQTQARSLADQQINEKYCQIQKDMRCIYTEVRQVRNNQVQVPFILLALSLTFFIAQSNKKSYNEL